MTPKDPPGEAQMKCFQTQNVLDIIYKILKEKNKEIRTKKHKGNPFGPWVTPKDPPWEGSDEICSNSKCTRYHSHDPERINKRNSNQKTQRKAIWPLGDTQPPLPGEAQMKFFKLKRCHLSIL